MLRREITNFCKRISVFALNSSVCGLISTFFLFLPVFGGFQRREGVINIIVRIFAQLTLNVIQILD
jgi:hypothetical protein